MSNFNVVPSLSTYSAAEAFADLPPKVSVDGPVDATSDGDDVSSVDLSEFLHPSVDESHTCPLDDLGAFGSCRNVTTQGVDRLSQTYAPFSFPPDAHLSSSSTFDRRSDMTIVSDTIPLVTDFTTFFTERRENNVISRYPVHRVVESPPLTVKVGAKVKSACVHGKLVEIIGIREGQAWFLCREADRRMSFVVMDIEYVRLPWHWRLKVILQHIHDRWKEWLLIRRLRRSWGTDFRYPTRP